MYARIKYSGRKISRRYQRGWSKQTINDNRYRLKGRTQSKGTGAICWQIIFVVAKSAVHEQPAKSNHQRRDSRGEALVFLRVLLAVSGLAPTGSRIRRKAQMAEQIRTNANKPDQAQACAVNVNLGSI